MSQHYRIRIALFIFIIAALGAAVVLLIGNKIPVGPPPPTAAANSSGPAGEIIGRSVEGRPIETYTYFAAVPPGGTAAPAASTTRLLFVGGIHGGYEWNSVILAYDFMDYLSAHPDFVPQGMSITVIPDSNPDGVFKIIGKEGRFTLSDVPTAADSSGLGRFNAENVDLNRNFDCKWQAKSAWKGHTVSGGSAPFSEPESKALRDFILKVKPVAAIFWHSQSGNVYASSCVKGILPATMAIMNVYAKAAGYGAIKTFDAYATSGAAEDWLASIGIPALTVELTTHQDVEWAKNLAGIKAVTDYFNSGQR